MAELEFEGGSVFSEACALSFFRLLPRPLPAEGQLGASITHPPRAHDVMLSQPRAGLGFCFLIWEVLPLTRHSVAQGFYEGATRGQM